MSKTKGEWDVYHDNGEYNDNIPGYYAIEFRGDTCNGEEWIPHYGEPVGPFCSCAGAWAWVKGSNRVMA